MEQPTWYCVADEEGTEGPTDRRLRSVIASASGALSCSQVSLTATCSRPEGLQSNITSRSRFSRCGSYAKPVKISSDWQIKQRWRSPLRMHRDQNMQLNTASAGLATILMGITLKYYSVMCIACDSTQLLALRRRCVLLPASEVAEDKSLCKNVAKQTTRKGANVAPQPYDTLLLLGMSD